MNYKVFVAFLGILIVFAAIGIVFTSPSSTNGLLMLVIVMQWFGLWQRMK